MTQQKETTGPDAAAGFVPSYLLYLLAACSDAASAEFHAQVRALGLRVPEWRVLACLNDQDGQMVTKLAEFALVEQSRLTKIIDQMVARGLLERRADGQDKRRVRVCLTAQGRQISAELTDKARAHELSVLARLPKDQAAQLKPTLQALLATLKPNGH